jgi:transcriptional regulator with XRE-family HTH domain
MQVKKVQVMVVPNLGKRIREARIASGLSPTEVAFHAGVSAPRLYQIEGMAETETLLLSVLRRIEAVLGVDFGVRFPDEPERAPAAPLPSQQHAKAQTKTNPKPKPWRSISEVSEAEWQEQLRLHREQGRSPYEMGKALGVADSSIRHRLKRLKEAQR